MNVRIVCPDFTSFGGSQLAVWYLARHLRAHDHAVRVLSFTADEMPGVEIRRVRNGLGSGLTRILKLRRSAKGELRSGERRYATGPDDPTADVVTFHACAQSRLEAISNGRIRFSGSSFRDLLRPVYHRGYLSATAFMERRIVRRALSGRAVLTAVSTTLADQIRNAYAEDVRIDVTPNGVDRFVYSPQAVSSFRSASRSKLGLTNDDFVVGFVGGDWHRKNLRTFIRAVHAARKRIRRVIGIVLGNGDPSAFATEPGIINDEIRFAGVTRSPVEFYSAMDVFYSPSPVESFGLPALEAMACGIPVVVCAGVGLLDFLNPGDAVVLSDAFDCEAASMILARLCEDVPFRSQLSKAGAEASARLPWARGAGVIEARLMAV